MKREESERKRGEPFLRMFARVAKKCVRCFAIEEGGERGEREDTLGGA